MPGACADRRPSSPVPAPLPDRWPAVRPVRARARTPTPRRSPRSRRRASDPCTSLLSWFLLLLEACRAAKRDDGLVVRADQCDLRRIRRSLAAEHGVMDHGPGRLGVPLSERVRNTGRAPFRQASATGYSGWRRKASTMSATQAELLGRPKATWPAVGKKTRRTFGSVAAASSARSGGVCES